MAVSLIFLSCTRRLSLAKTCISYILALAICEHNLLAHMSRDGKCQGEKDVLLSTVEAGAQE